MNNQKKSKNMLKGFLARRQFRYGGYATVLTAVVIAVVILLNVAIGAVETNWALAIDVTALGATDFTDQTLQIVDDVNEPVHIYTLYQDATNHKIRIQTEEVLNKYHALNGSITFSNIDPIKNPALVEKYAGDDDLSEGALILVNEDESRVKIIDLIEYYYQYTSPYNEQTYTLFSLEPAVTSALLFVTSDETPRIFFLEGHGEMDTKLYFTTLTDELKGQNFEVGTINLTTDTDTVLEAGDTLVIINPVRDLSDTEYNVLKSWLADGGRMMFMLDYSTDESVLRNFTALLDYYQLSFGDGVIAESTSSTSNWTSDIHSLIPNLNTGHEITAPLSESGYYLILPQVRPINDVAMPEADVTYDKLLTTSAAAVVEGANGSSLPGTQTIAMSMVQPNAADPDKDVRIVVMGSFYSMADTNLIYASYNMNYTLNVFNWLANRDTVVEIGARLITTDTLAVPDIGTVYTLAAVVIVAIPVIVLVAGVVIWIKRRRLKWIRKMPTSRITIRMSIR